MILSILQKEALLFASRFGGDSVLSESKRSAEGVGRGCSFLIALMSIHLSINRVVTNYQVDELLIVITV